MFLIYLHKAPIVISNIRLSVYSECEKLNMQFCANLNPYNIKIALSVERNKLFLPYLRSTNWYTWIANLSFYIPTIQFRFRSDISIKPNHFQLDGLSIPPNCNQQCCRLAFVATNVPPKPDWVFLREFGLTHMQFNDMD